MLEVPEKYREMADSDAREIALKVVIGNTVLTNDDIIELEIYRSLGESGFNIGGVVASRLRLLALMKLPYSGEVTMDVFVRFGLDDENASEYVQFGHFYGHASNPSYKTAQVEIIGYDKLGSSGFNSRCTFAKFGSAELTFPCTVREMLEYVCERKGLESDFECLDYTVSEMPVKDRSKDDSDYEKYYTYKEIVGFIAAAHGASAAIDNSGKLVFIGINETEETVNSGDCIDFALTYSEKFTVKGVLLHVQNVLSTGSTNIFINDDSKTAYDGEISEGVVETSCPFGSIEIAENLWAQLGGFSYNSCEFTRRGRGWTELGDVITAVDNLDVKLGGEYKNRQMIAQTIEWSFTADGGFMEHIISKAENSEESAERLGSGNAINNSSGGVGKFTNEAKNSEMFNDYTNNYINPGTHFAHVSGYKNSIDEGEGITNYSVSSSALGGTQNKITNSPLAAIVCGTANIIQNANMACIAGGNGNSCAGTMSFIGGGMTNKIMSALFSAICGGNGNSISATGLARAFIGGGSGNKITGGTEAAIVGGSNNTTATTGSGILSGNSNSIDGNGYCSAVVCGTQNHVQGSCSAILCGSGNTVKLGSSAVIAGVENLIEATYSVVAGNGNKITGNGLCCFVFGDDNSLNGSHCFVCGVGAKANFTHAFVIGNSELDNINPNIFYVDRLGNVYAKSFNIIGETTSEISTFSARSADTPDLSELSEQLTKIKADIEALKEENAALKAEIELLKAR